MRNFFSLKTFLSLLLLLSIASAAIALPNANAHTPPWNIPTYAYIVVAPDPVGVDQQLSLIYWLDKVPPTAAGFGGDRWANLTITVIKPDGSNETLGPFISDPVGGGYALYTPDQTGTYTFTFNFKGQVASLNHPTTGLAGTPSDYVGDYYMPSNATAKVTVQQEKISPTPDYGLPTSYWRRPIEGQNTGWATIASNSLSGSSKINHYQPDGTAPNSGHIMWTKPLQFGGVVGGSNTLPNGITYYDGTNYENKFTDPIIINGYLYYTLPRSDSQPGGFAAVLGGGYVCVDLRTGKEIWRRTDLGVNVTSPSFAQLYDYESFNQHGVIPNGYLWSTNENPFAALFGLPVGPTTWQAYDPIDGAWLFSLTGIPPGTEGQGPNGEIIRYVLNVTSNWLALWNNTAPLALTASMGPNDTTSTNAYQWRPIGKNVDTSNAYTWNVTIPQLPPRSSIIAAIYDDIIVGQTPLAAFLTFGTPDPVTIWAISLKPETRGNLLWMKNITAPPGNVTRSLGPVDRQAKVFTYFDKETVSWTGYSMDTGEKLWGPTPSENAWNFHTGAGGAMTTSVAAEGKFYSTGYSGIVYCYNDTTGELLWNYTAPAGLDTPYSGYPLGIAGLADGKLYLITNEHSSIAPYWKGAKLRCVNIIDGTELWAIYGHGTSTFGTAGSAIADGYFVYLNLYDMQVYCVGKGPSETTVDAPLSSVIQGQNIIIRGTVTDKSAGAKRLIDDGLFNTVPAVSDQSMDEWMEYLYMQKPIPANVTGVNVHITATDPNGNIQDLGYATTDYSGLYSMLFNPQMEGKYTIVATFEGTESYWPSFSETAIAVNAAIPGATAAPTATPAATTTPRATQTPSPSPPPQSPSPSPYTPPAVAAPTSTYIAIGAAIVIIVAIAAAMLLRRRK